MKRSMYHNALSLILAALSILFVAGCHSNTTDAKPGDELNSGMSDKQKALISQHKKQAEQ